MTKVEQGILGAFIDQIDKVYTESLAETFGSFDIAVATLRSLREIAMKMHDNDTISFSVADRIWDYATEVIQKLN